MACFEVIILKNRIERAFQVKDGENFNEKEGTTTDILLFLDVINVKDIATTSMSVFRNLHCLSLVACSNTTLLKLQTVLFLLFFQILRFEIGGAAYLWMRLIHGRLRYL